MIVLLFEKITETKIVNKSNKKEEIDVYDRMDLFFRQKFNITWFKHALGLFLSFLCGSLGAFVNEPEIYVMNNEINASQDFNDYVFSLNCGILLSSLCLFIIYCIVLKNKPKIYPKIIFPCFLVGF